MRAVTVLCFALLAIATAAHPQLQRLHHPKNKKAQWGSTPSAQNQALAFYRAVESRAAPATLATYFSDDLVACVFAHASGAHCHQTSQGWANSVSNFINSTSLMMLSPVSIFPPVNQQYAAIHFVDAGIDANSLTSYSLETFSIVQVDENNRIERYFEFNDLSTSQTNATSMKQVANTFYQYVCSRGMSHVLALFTANPYVVDVTNGHNQFLSNSTQLAAAWKPFFDTRVDRSCNTVVERIGVAGDYVFVQRHSAWQTNLVNATGHTLERGVDVFRLSIGDGGNVLIDDWYFYGHRRTN